MASVPRDQIDPRYNLVLDKALDEYRESQQVVLERAAPHINLGWLARQLGDTQQAADELRLAIRMESYLTGPRSELANMLAEQGSDADEIRQLRVEEADHLDRDALLLPDNADVRYRLGLMRYLLGQYAAADKALTEACELAPASFDFRMALALLQERRYERDSDTAQFDAAEQSLDEMAKLRPDDPRTEQIRQRLHATRQAAEAASRPASSP